MEIKIKRTDDFIPEWEDNKKDEKPIVFHLRYLSVGEQDDCFKIKPIRVTKAGKVTTTSEIIQDDKRLFNYAVMSIDNLFVNDGKKNKIDSSEELLLTPGLDVLYYEVLGHIKAMNARLDSKN